MYFLRRAKSLVPNVAYSSAFYSQHRRWLAPAACALLTVASMLAAPRPAAAQLAVSQPGKAIFAPVQVPGRATILKPATPVQLPGWSTTPSTISTPRAPLAYSHIPFGLAAYSSVGSTPAAQPLTVDLVLPLRNQAAAQALLAHVTNPTDPLYGHYLTPDQFRVQFAPTNAQAETVEAFAAQNGLSIIQVAPSNLYVKVRGTVGQINAAFGVSLKNYVDVTGRTFHAADTEPVVDSNVAPFIGEIVGLSNEGVPHNNVQIYNKPRPKAGAGGPMAPIYFHGTYGLTPTDTSSVYGMTSAIQQNIYGSGQTMGLFEIGGFNASDPANFFKDVKWPTNPTPLGTTPKIIPISVDQYDVNGGPDDDALEVTLDLEMFESWAYGANQIQVYETPEDIFSYQQISQSFVDAFTAMANATSAPYNETSLPGVISVSYGVPEIDVTASDVQAEAVPLLQLALQGQTVCVSAGDSGAFAEQTGVELPNVDDPGSQPYVTCVGGTDLMDTRDLATGAELLLNQSSWENMDDFGRGYLGTGGGGGVSSYWPLPSYQTGLFTQILASNDPQGSTSNRNTPDVSLFGDYDTGGYEMYMGGDTAANGTSAASPLWAALLADVNQVRAASGGQPIGFANPAIYDLAETGNYYNDFFDVDDNSNNLWYYAGFLYDNSTGWGTVLNATSLINDLAAEDTSATFEPGFIVTPADANVSPGQPTTGTVQLLNTGAATTTAYTFTLTSSNSVVTVPGTVQVQAGANFVQFPITSAPTPTPVTVTITATLQGSSLETHQTTVTADPTLVATVQVTPGTITGAGATSAGLVTLTNTATTATAVSIVTSDANAAPGSATVAPVTVTIPAGSITGTFTATALSVLVATNVTITGTAYGVPFSTTLTVDPAAPQGGGPVTTPVTTPGVTGLSPVQSVVVNPSSVIGGHYTTGVVTLTGVAPTGGETVTLRSSNAGAASVPATVVVPAGSASVVFSLTTVAVHSPTSVKIFGSADSSTQTATVTLLATSSKSPSLPGFNPGIFQTNASVSSPYSAL